MEREAIGEGLGNNTGGLLGMPEVVWSKVFRAGWFVALVCSVLLERIFKEWRNALPTEKPLAEFHCPGDRWLGSLASFLYHPQQCGPIDLIHASELTWSGVHESRGISPHKHKALLIDTSASGAAKHLEQFVRAKLALETTIAIGRGRNHDGFYRKIDPRSETGGRDNDIKFAFLAEGFDPL
jgi:hypothetical protein